MVFFGTQRHVYYPAFLDVSRPGFREGARAGPGRAPAGPRISRFYSFLKIQEIQFSQNPRNQVFSKSKKSSFLKIQEITDFTGF